MTRPTGVKICGLSDADHVRVAAEAGAAFVGFVFFPKSPRNVSLDQAHALATRTPAGLCKVALTVDADDAQLSALLDRVPIDMLQLHGHETPDRVASVKSRFGLPVMKAVGVATAADLDDVARYGAVADMLLIDAKPPKTATLPGGNGLSFDWSLLAGRRWSLPWMLAGGLSPDNVAEAILRTGAPNVDVSSGVETAPGQKDPDLIRGFVGATRQDRAAPPNLKTPA